MDLRATLVFFGVLDGPLHGPLYTLLGATILAGALTAVPLRPSLDIVLNWFRIRQRISLRRILVAALVGCWPQVLLDAILYTDLQPLAPFSTVNPASGVVGFLADGPRRFNELKRAVGDAPPNVLSDRLKQLEAVCLVSRTVQDTTPPRVCYELTDRGRELQQLIDELERL